ncbi:MAG: hypothetical protein KGD63_06355 [Candidatus Lokiarchaeota archaeon]|nr:hypothetical protein [Candidatus Lokiarchaeota archaeon]
MYRSYLLKNNFWAKKGNEKNDDEKVFIKHDSIVGGVYAVIQKENKGVKIVAEGEEHFFTNFDRLDSFLNQLHQRKDNFIKILKRKNISQRLRTLDI